MGQLKLAEYKSVGDSVSLAKIDGQNFTVIAVENSDYTDGNNTTPGVKISTKEEFTVDGNKISKFHTTRQVIVDTFKNESLRSSLAKGDELGPLICKKNAGNRYFSLEEAS